MLRVDLTMIVELFTELEGSTERQRYQPISIIEHICTPTPLRESIIDKHQSI
jgi:hypothetical protein